MCELQQGRFAQAPAEHIRHAREGIARVMQLLQKSGPDSGDQTTAALAEVSEHLRTAAELLRDGEPETHAGFKSTLEQLRREVKTLAFSLSASDRLVSGWINALGSRQGGYTAQGGSAPLILIKKVNFTG